MPLKPFQWQPRLQEVESRPRPVFASTPIEDIGIKPAAVRRLRELSIFYLEDCAHATLRELLVTRDIGSTTVFLIRSRLNSLGLDFKESDDPTTALYDRARVFRQEPIQRRVVCDDSHLIELGLRDATIARALLKGIDTIGKARALKAFDFYYHFGRSQGRELFDQLQASGMSLETEPTNAELCRYRLRESSELPFPGDDASSDDLGPWLGAVVQTLKSAGVATVGDVRSAAARQHKIQGIGSASWARISDVLNGKGRAGRPKSMGMHKSLSERIAE